MNWKTTDFDYTLPTALIAQTPLAQRSASRLLHLDRDTGAIGHHRFVDVLNLVNSNDLLIFNNTKVMPARLFGRKASGGRIEVLIERILDSHTALAHIRASKSPKPGTELVLEPNLGAHVVERVDDLFKLQFTTTQSIESCLWQHGQLPLPPYIERPVAAADHERYQTVFAQVTGAIAAPTASLHFDALLLEQLAAQGVQTAELTLHVGAGTFQPVRVADLTTHQMHSEWFAIDEDVVEAVAACRARQGRVIAVGTTVLRALEAASQDGCLRSYRGDTDIFIYPGFTFHTVDALITNFHLPKSTLLMLVAAFAGRESMFRAYEQAIAQQYRFFSYGDAMLIASRC